MTTDAVLARLGAEAERLRETIDRLDQPGPQTGWLDGGIQNVRSKSTITSDGRSSGRALPRRLLEKPGIDDHPKAETNPTIQRRQVQ